MKSSSDTLGAQLAETARVWRNRLDQRLRPLGLSQTRWMTILHLSKTEAGLPQSELAGRLGITHASLSPQVERLVRDGWVERHSLDSDRRCKQVRLTDQARELSQQIQRTAAKLRGELLQGLPAEDIEVCQRVLAHIAARAQQL